MKTELVALKGKLRCKPFQLNDGKRLVIGRGLDADIQILDSALSRQHCSLERTGDEFFLNDMKSRNGTWVNDERIKRKKLDAGDRVRFGSVEFEFRCGPERRRQSANLIASFPEMPGRDVHEKVEPESSDLMSLTSEFQNIETFRRIQRDLATIYRVGNVISGEPDPTRLYERIIDAVFQVVKADRAFLLIGNAAGELEKLADREKKTLSGDESGQSFSTTIVKECYTEGSSILRANAMLDDDYREADSVIIQNIHSVVCVPVKAPQGTLGVIYADTISQAEAFTKYDLELLAAVGKQAGVAVHRAKLADQVRNLLYGTVRALVATIEAKDEYTRGHSERVTTYAVQIGKAMKLDAEDLRILELGGLLHDVGKIGVPENILRKAGPLTDDEYQIIKQHPKVGHNILKEMDGADTIGEMVRHHHERWDGKGYPDGLAKDGSSLLARILTVADSFDAMSSRRPYRDRLAQEKVLREIKRNAGTQFDPDVAEAMLAEAAAGRISVEMAQNATANYARQG